MVQLFVLWSARLSMLLLLGSLLLPMILASTRVGRISRGIYLVGAVVLWIHIALAFQFVHGWDHAQAYDHTARQTEAVTGMNWGGGVYVNYLFGLLWLGDALFPYRLQIAKHALQAFMLFIAFNATVIFAGSPARWWWLAIWVVFAAVLATGQSQRRRSN